MFAINATIASFILGLALFALPVNADKSASAECCCKDKCTCVACECVGDCSGSCCGESCCEAKKPECAPKAGCGGGCSM